jgi:hypothetical protein
MIKKIYRVKVKYTFDGFYEVLADSKVQAKKIVSNNTSLVMGSSITVNSNAESIKEFDFPIHPEIKMT